MTGSGRIGVGGRPDTCWGAIGNGVTGVAVVVAGEVFEEVTCACGVVVRW